MENFDNNEIILEENKLTIEEQIYQIEVRMQEIDAKIEQFEDVYYQTSEEIFPYEEYEALKEEYKKLRSEKKRLLKENKQKGFWDKMPVWMFAYGVFQVIFSFFYVISMVSILFAQWFFNTFNVSEAKFWDVFTFFFIPFISLLISVIILLLIKNKERKKVFLIVFSIQAVETIISVIIMASYLVKTWNS